MAYQLSAVFDLGGNYIQQMKKAQDTTGVMNKSLTTTGSGFSKLASIAAKAGAIIGLGLGIKDMITKASSAQLVLTQMDTVLKSTAGAAGMSKTALTQFAEAQGKSTLFSNRMVESGENLMLTFTGIGKKVFPSTMKAAEDMSQAMGTDLNSTVLTLGKALNSPVDGMSKLQKQGVTFTKQQKDQVAAMAKVGNVAGGQAIMLKELQKEFGGSAAAAGKTFAGQLTILKNSMSGVEASLGGALLPYLQKFITSVNTNIPQIKQVLASMITYIVPKFQQFITLTMQIAQQLLPSFGKSATDAKTKAANFATGGVDIVIASLTWIKNNMGIVRALIVGVTAVWVLQKAALLANNSLLLINNVQTAAKIVASTVETAKIYLTIIAQDLYAISVGKGTLATKAITVAQYLFNTAMDLNPIGVVILALAALGLAIYEVVKHWKDICTWISKAWDWLKKWNGTPATNKTATMTTKNVTSYGSVPTKAIAPIGLHGYATGTTYATKGPAYVGEFGKEIVNFKGGETVTSASNSKNSTANGQPFIINNYFSNVVGEESFFEQCGQAVSKKIVTAIANMG